jgi:hypothetical protein
LIFELFGCPKPSVMRISQQKLNAPLLSNITEFPVDIFFSLKNYFVPEQDPSTVLDSLRTSVTSFSAVVSATKSFTNDFSELHCWMNFLNSSKLFAFIKRECIHYHLNEELSLAYLEGTEDRYLRRTLDSLLENVACPQRQISLQISRAVSPRSLPFQFKKADAFQGLRYLNLRGLLLDDVSFLGKIYCLNLSYCPLLKDVSALSEVKVLFLSSCSSLEDVSALGKVTKLDISSCPKVKDVSVLGKVSDLNLSHCDSIEDISALSNVLILNVAHCYSLSRGFANPCCFIKSTMEQLTISSNQMELIAPWLTLHHRQPSSEKSNNYCLNKKNYSNKSFKLTMNVDSSCFFQIDCLPWLNEFNSLSIHYTFQA